MLKLLRTCHRPACQIMSNAFLKSMKLWNRSRWYRVVEQIALVPLYDDSTMEDLFYCAPT